MRAAVEQYALYRRGADQWMLGRFVLPAARLSEFEECAGELRGDGAPWRLSAIASAADAPVVTAFNEKNAGRALVDAIEGKAGTPAEVAALAAFGGAFEVYVEIPMSADSAPLLTAIKSHGFRAKLRTGGVTVEAFPAPAQLAVALAECARQDVALKLTAGLHHPIRGAYNLTYAADSAAGTMFGFLNVFLASMFLRAGMSLDEASALLDERDASTIVVGHDRISWRGHSLNSADVRRLRAAGALSFGSCSFTEPVGDLTSLGFL